MPARPAVRGVDDTCQPAPNAPNGEMNMHRAPCPLDAAGGWCSRSLAQLLNSAIAMNWHVAAAQT
jgi:hypothetical protein